MAVDICRLNVSAPLSSSVPTEPRILAKTVPRRVMLPLPSHVKVRPGYCYLYEEYVLVETHYAEADER